ncbi:META domain-containing protein [Hellea balneolensis]|uniref:META domain-containing protein n=1 Tax=Hellea balneolensis TaxID=287478 RepID=UPI000415BD96|nr:META domain-containing protein [Hellea balneolensis]
MIRLISIGLMTLGALAFTKIAKAQIADLKGQEPLTNLEGTEWGPENGMGQFVQFLSGGDMAGYAGCNSFFGTYEQNGNSLKIGSMVMTKKACENLGMEQAFIAALESARSFEASAKEMNILDENNEVGLSMRRRDWD